MQRPTFSQLRSSSFPRALGLCATDFGDIRDGANECQERLVFDPMTPDEGWWGGWAKMAFAVQPTGDPNGHAYITTPRDVARIVGIAVCQQPRMLRNGFYEFLEFSPGLQPRATACGNGTLSGQDCGCRTSGDSFDRDNQATLSDLAGTPQFVRIFSSNSGDLGKRVLVQGVDQNGQTILTIDPLTGLAVKGEFVTLSGPFVQTVNQFSTITGLSKEATLGPVVFQQVDASTGVTAPLSKMEPSEVTGWYRRYLLTGLPRNCCASPAGTVTVTAMARLELTPITTDADYLFIPSIGAMVHEASSLRYDRLDNEIGAKLSASHHAKAIAMLNAMLDVYVGKVSVSIRVPLGGSDRFRLNPR